jgi:hypothetical protein
MRFEAALGSLSGLVLFALRLCRLIYQLWQICHNWRFMPGDVPAPNSIPLPLFSENGLVRFNA